MKKRKRGFRERKETNEQGVKVSWVRGLVVLYFNGVFLVCRGAMGNGGRSVGGVRIDTRKLTKERRDFIMPIGTRPTACSSGWE